MSARIFKLRPDLTTRDVNSAIRSATRSALAEFPNLEDYPGGQPKPNEERRRGSRKGKTTLRYVFGVGNELRDTLLACYEPGSGQVELVRMMNYPGWQKADDYTRMRVRFNDHLVRQTNITSPHLERFSD